MAVPAAGKADRHQPEPQLGAYHRRSQNPNQPDRAVEFLVGRPNVQIESLFFA